MDDATDNIYLRHKLEELRQNYKLTPATLMNRINPLWIPAPHLLYVSAEIAHAIAKGNGRVTISFPPRHGKSELITKGTSIWTLERFPTKQVILASYGAELSTDFGRAVRDIIDENHGNGLLNVSIRPDATKVGGWLTPEGGGMRSTGLGGPITGRGAHVLLIDDYIKEIKEAMSQSHRDYIWDWFVTTALTRLEPGATVIIIATRWHHDDLIGRIEKNNPGGRWKHIVIPAESFGNKEYDREVDWNGEIIKLRDLFQLDPQAAYDHGYWPEKDVDFLGRRYGDPLFPQRYGIEELRERRETLGTYFYNAIYQQVPEDENAKLTDVNWLKPVMRADELPPLDANFMSKPVRVWDLAATEGAGDYTTGAHMIMDTRTKEVIVLDLIRKQLSPERVELLVRQCAEQDGAETRIIIEQEPGSSGKALVEHYRRNVLPGYAVLPWPANDGKLARAQPLLAGCEARKVRLLQGPWNKAYFDEFGSWPSDSRKKHDDQVDVTAIGYSHLTGKKSSSATFGRRVDSYKKLAEIEASRPRAGVVFGRRRSGQPRGSSTWPPVIN